MFIANNKIKFLIDWDDLTNPPSMIKVPANAVTAEWISLTT